jgi:hypothetical protein
MSVMAQVGINSIPAVAGDVVAAFVTVGGIPQLRGKESVMVVSGIAGCLLQVYTESNGEVISFKVWDESAQQVCDVTQTLASEVGGIVGSMTNLYQINAETGTQVITDPWGEPAVLTGSMSVMAQVAINSVPAVTGDILAAFVTVGTDEQLRGKIPIQVIQGIAGCLIQVFTETNGEQVTFKVWDFSAQTIVPVTQTLPSEAGGIVGSFPDNLYQINAGTGAQVVAMPVFNPAEGTYQTAQSVVISCSTPGAQIRYTTNGTEPTLTSTLYSAPINVAATTTVKAKAFLTNWSPSATVTAVYTITGTVATPTLTPAGGIYQTAQNVTIACATAGAQIRYTSNGTVPTEASALYSTPISLPLNSTTTIKAKAYLTGWAPSEIINAVYTITGTVATPVITPPAGTYATAQTVSITCATVGSQIRYTTNGAEPTLTSTLYSAPINVATSMTVKAKGFLTNWTSSASAVANYTITGTVATPSFSPEPGQYQNQVDVSMACSTPGAQIRYTLNDTEPVETSFLYANPIHISQSTTFRAKAFLTGWTPSATATAIYSISVANPENPAAPVVTGIHGIYPNPFSDITNIKLGISEANQGYQLNIYNIKGECVYRIEGNAKGSIELIWNGYSNDGTKLPSGVYLISFSSGSTSQTRKAVLK